MPRGAPLDYVAKIAQKAGASATTEGVAARIVTEPRKERLTSGEDPSGLVGAAIYIASQLTGERRTSTELSRAADVTSQHQKQEGRPSPKARCKFGTQ